MKAKLGEYRREIGAVLIVKILLIFSLKALFFSDPVDRNLSERAVELHLFGAGPTASISNPEGSCDADRTDC
ncbi:MAG: cytochrome oxidase putative small subunit CydP [Gammaproteobacteria bacterium]